jgi:hypothetical protein
MAKQTYDAEGTIFYSFSLIVDEQGKSKRWMMIFTQGMVSIVGCSTGLSFVMNYPKEEHWEYQCLEKVRQDRNTKRGAKIENSKFTLEIWVSEPFTEDDPDFGTGCSVPDGELVMKVGEQSMSSYIPYTVALALIKFTGGSTDIEGATYVTKY